MLLALFDVDGTLFLTHDEVMNRATIDALEEVYGLPIPDDAVVQVDHQGQTAPRIARLVLRREGLDDEAIGARLAEWCRRSAERYLDLLDRAPIDGWRSPPGAPETLAALQEHGLTLALLTGNPEAVARARMRRLGLERFFPEGQGAFGCEAEERGELLRLALERAGAPGAETVAVGDTCRDVSSARAAGVRSIVVAYGRARRDDFRSADAVVDGMPALLRQLLAWQEAGRG